MMTDYQFLETLLDKNQKNKKNNSKYLPRWRLTNNHKMWPDYLDVTLTLNDGTCRSFHKPNDETFNISVKYGYPPQILKKILNSTEERLSHLTSTREIFQNSKEYYGQSLKQCRYDEKLNYTEEVQYATLV